MKISTKAEQKTPQEIVMVAPVEMTIKPEIKN
jgi:hypothetical protein